MCMFFITLKHSLYWFTVSNVAFVNAKKSILKNKFCCVEKTLADKKLTEIRYNSSTIILSLYFDLVILKWSVAICREVTSLSKCIVNITLIFTTGMASVKAQYPRK